MAAHSQDKNSSSGPVVVSEKTYRALAAIRRENLLRDLYKRVCIAHSNWMAIPSQHSMEVPVWLDVVSDRPDGTLPARCGGATVLEAASIRLATALPASMLLIDGPIKEKVKLSFIKAEGTVAILVEAYRRGKLSAVRPMVKALQSLGYSDILPSTNMLDAMWIALDQLDC